MDHLVPSASFRTTRPPTRSRNRSRQMSPSPRPNIRRPFTDSAPNTMFITTDYDYDYMCPSSPDSDLIFSMSPVHSYISSSPGREPINVMTLRNKPQRNISPPLSPLLYSFPRPSRLHPYMKQNTSTSKDILSSKALSSISQKFGASTLGGTHSSRSANAIEAGPIAQDHPLAASLVESTLPHTQERKPEEAAPPNPKRHPLDSHPSSPIPIPRHTPRQADPGPFVTNTISSPPLSTIFAHQLDLTPLPSSGIASHIPPAGVRGLGKNASGHASPARSSAPKSPLRIEGFDASESGCVDLLGTDDEMLSATFRKSQSSVVSSTAYSISDSAPFRFSMFLESDSEDQRSENADGEAERGNVLTQNNAGAQRRLVPLRVY